MKFHSLWNIFNSHCIISLRMRMIKIDFIYQGLVLQISFSISIFSMELFIKILIETKEKNENVS